MQDLRLEDIDWNRMHRTALAEKSSPRKTAADWDRKAESFAERNSGSLYAEKFIDLLRPEPSWSVLDIGCGPGTIALPLAARVKNITALDFSGAMLDILNNRAAEANITNITTARLSWTDDWAAQGIAPHDAAIASRSLAVNDLEAALIRLNESARKVAAVTDRVGPGPFDPGAYRAVGRNLEPGPDYIYTVNILYRLGIHASVDFIHLEDEIPCASFAEAMEMYTWMFRNLSAAESEKLQHYVRSVTTRKTDGTILLHRPHAPTWAFIRWQPRHR